MSFPRHGEIYRSDVVFKTIEDWGPGAASRWSAPGPSQRMRPKGRVPLIVRDEFPVGYSLAGCSPAEPASASPTTLSMRWGRGAGNCLSANGNLSLVSVSQARGSLQCRITLFCREPFSGVLRGVRRTKWLSASRQWCNSALSLVSYSGPDLVSATNPENGTVAYTHNGVHQVTSRTDAKGQVTQYAYDSYGRLLSQQYFLPLGGDLVEDTSQAVTYTYDSNPYGGDNVLGRLGVVNFGQSRYDYSYNTAGRVTQQNLQTQISFPDANWNTVSYPTSLTASYGWDDEGRMTSTQSPAGTYNYSFDAMGRLGGMADGNSNPVASATYGVAGQLLSLWMNNGTTETRETRVSDQLPGFGLEIRRSPEAHERR